MEYDNRNKGVLFPVHDKQGNDRRPDYTGSVNINGTEYELAGWEKSSKAGNPYMSLSIKPKGERAPASNDRGTPGRDIPW